MPSLLESALTYHRAGWRIHPLHPSDKRPVLNDWSSFRFEDEAAVAEWWARRRRDNIGLICGWPLVVVDCDGEAQVERALRLLPTTPGHSISGSGSGAHLIYRWTTEAKTPHKCTLWRGPGKHQSIDLLARGANLVLAPSIHPTGGAYRWASGADTPPNVADLPLIDWSTVECLRDSVPTAPRGQVLRPAANAAAIIQACHSAGIFLRELGEWSGNRRYAIVCPWAHEHSERLGDKATDTVVLVKGSAIGFSCLHAHCSDRTAGDLAAALDLPTASDSYSARRNADAERRFL